MKYLKFPVLAILVFLIVGCGTKDPIGPGTQNNLPPTSIMPLKIGNVWLYDFEWYTGPSSPPDVVYDYSITVMDTVRINGEKWYQAAHAVTSVGWTQTVYYTNRNGGLYFRFSTADGATEYLRFKYPASIGDTYNSTQMFLFTEFGFTGSYPSEMMGTSVSVTVPHGTHNCYYQYADYDPGTPNPVSLKDYFKPNLGMVKSDFQVYDGSVYFTYFVWKLKQVQLQ